MGSSIQDYLKKINSTITWHILISLLVTVFFLGLFLLFLYIKNNQGNIPVSYIENVSQNNNKIDKNLDFRPFASINGKTYTFYWCQGGDKIKDINKIYFDNEEKAIKSGRFLSKLCK